MSDLNPHGNTRVEVGAFVSVLPRMTPRNLTLYRDVQYTLLSPVWRITHCPLGAVTLPVTGRLLGKDSSLSLAAGQEEMPSPDGLRQ